MKNAPTSPTTSAKNAEGDYEQFKGFMRQLVSVPNETIKARPADEKRTRVKRATASPAPAAS